jgi:hypothetical protein
MLNRYHPELMTSNTVRGILTTILYLWTLLPKSVACSDECLNKMSLCSNDFTDIAVLLHFKCFCFSGIRAGNAED